MVAKKKSDDLERIVIDETEFLSTLLQNINILEDKAAVIESQQAQYTKLYRNYLFDKEIYDLHFFIYDGCVCYDKTRKNKIGFKK